MEKCWICKKQFKKITASHLRTHNISHNDYISKQTKNSEKSLCSYSGSDGAWPCTNEIIESDNSEHCILHSDNPNKSLISFQNSFDAYLAKQKENSLLSTIFLDHIHFPEKFNLSRVSFPKFVSATYCTFRKNTQIKRCKFVHGATFKGSKFYGDIFIQRVEFQSIADFVKTEFYNEVEFSLTSFQGLTLYKSGIGGVLKFSDCTFKEFVSFRNVALPSEKSLLSFYLVDFPTTGRTWFEENDMSKVSFIETNLKNVRFINVQWHKPNWPYSKRKSLVNEFVNFNGGSLSSEYYARVRSEYQQLKQNFEDARNYSEAGDFYYGEMECIRKSNIFRRYMPNTLNLYRISSGYGQRYVRAFIVLLLLLLTFSLTHMFLGLKPNKQSSELKVINYTSSSFLSNSAIFDLLATNFYCIEVLIREDEPDRILRPMNYIGDGINAFFTLLIYAQFLLFALALRRHFKR